MQGLTNGRYGVPSALEIGVNWGSVLLQRLDLASRRSICAWVVLILTELLDFVPNQGADCGRLWFKSSPRNFSFCSALTTRESIEKIDVHLSSSDEISFCAIYSA